MNEQLSKDLTDFLDPLVREGVKREGVPEEVFQRLDGITMSIGEIEEAVEGLRRTVEDVRRYLVWEKEPVHQSDLARTRFLDSVRSINGRYGVAEWGLKDK